MDLQKFENLLKQEVKSGNVEITEKEIRITIATLGMLSAFFGQPIITVG